MIEFTFPNVPKVVIELRQGDIVTCGAETIVNAANSALAGGGGVDGAIHRAAGEHELKTLTKPFGGCRTGSAVITTAGRIPLPTRYIIHAVGPVYRNGKSDEPEQLRSAYQTSLKLADEKQLVSIAFPAISTGVYGYPIDLAAPVVLQAVHDYLITTPATNLQTVIFMLFSAHDYKVYEQAVKNFKATLIQ